MKKQTIIDVCFFFVCFLVALQEYVSGLEAYVYEEDSCHYLMVKAVYALTLIPPIWAKVEAEMLGRTCPFG